MTPAAPGAATDADDTGGGTVELCIAVAQDGSLSVYQETGDSEDGEQNAQPVADIGEALKAILRMYRELSGGGAEDQMKAGFGANGQSPSAAAPSESAM